MPCMAMPCIATLRKGLERGEGIVFTRKKRIAIGIEERKKRIAIGIHLDSLPCILFRSLPSPVIFLAENTP